jgi:protoporphyrinogen/coproporphyrinogen III oxidase
MPVETIVLESGPDFGGSLATVVRDGFVMETGADSMITEKPWGVELARRVGLEPEIIPTRRQFRKTYVVHAGRLMEIPPGLAMIAPARIWPVLKSPLFSPLGKLRMALEPLIPARRDGGDESLASFVRRRLGREVLDRVAQPLAGGIYSCDPERLSLAATMPRFLEMERRYGSVVRGLRAAEVARANADATQTSGARWDLFVSFRAGMSALARALAARLEGVIRCNAEVAALSFGNGLWRLEFSGGRPPLEADAVICAAPAYVAARLVKPYASRLAEMLGAIAYASAATVNLAFRRSEFPAPLDSFGLVVPEIEHRRIIAVSFSSLKFEGRAPEDFVLARAFLGGALQDRMMALSDDDMAEVARAEFRSLLNVTATAQMVEVRRWPERMPQYAVGHLDRVAEIERALASIPGLALAGSAYRGVGVPDCVLGAEKAAEAIFEWLASRAAPTRQIK